MPVRRIARRVVKSIVYGIVPLALLVALVPGTGALAAPVEPRDIHFRWAFCRLMEQGDAARLDPIKEGLVLKAGDKVKMMVELQKKCFVYVIHQSSQGDISMLFPYSLDQFKTDYEPLKRYFIPAGEAWFQLDEHPGAETFFLLASDQRLVDIEYLFDRYNSADSARKPKVAAMVAAAIRDIGAHPQELVASAGSPAADERLTRGFERAESYDPSNIAKLADEIAASGLFSRTITIEHR